MCREVRQADGRETSPERLTCLVVARSSMRPASYPLTAGRNPTKLCGRNDLAAWSLIAINQRMSRWNHCTGRHLLKGRNPNPIADVQRPAEKGEGWVGPIVVTRKKIGALANAYIVANIDARMVVDPNAFTDPYVVADLEKPRGLY